VVSARRAGGQCTWRTITLAPRLKRSLVQSRSSSLACFGATCSSACRACSRVRQSVRLPSFGLGFQPTSFNTPADALHHQNVRRLHVPVYDVP